MYRTLLTLLLGAMALFGPGSDAAVAQSRAVARLPDLLEGAESVYSIDGGVSFLAEPPSVAPRQVATVEIMLTFEVSQAIHSLAGAGYYTSLTLSHDVASVRAMSLSLNDHEVALPLDRMIYRTVPGIDPRLLNSGVNTLLVEMTVRNTSRENEIVVAPSISLTPLESIDLAIQTGPLLGAFDEGFFTITCRTNMPARVSVYRAGFSGHEEGIEGLRLVTGTEQGLLHRLRVPRGLSAEEESYRVVAERDGFVVGRTVSPPDPPKGAFRFLVIGDTRTNVAEWLEVASAAVESGAQLVVHLGDMVTLGTRDWEWDAQFWQPGRVLLETMPIYPVIGNHEANAPLYDELFFGPAEDGGARNWAQELGGVQLIGIDGAQDWSSGSDNAGWLEETLSRSDARFTLLITHYPGWSSAPHGRLGDDGRPRERPARETRETVIPLLVAHGATAIIAGHDHVYERSELPGDLSAVTCGGGGAGLYRKVEDAARQNPYSRVFSSVHHYCVFEVDSATMAMRALTAEGELLDSRTWHARDE
jgi:predicted phosphodiesterase